MKHEFDPRTRLNKITWHEDPELVRFFEDVVDVVKPDVFVETGSHMGWTAGWVAERYPSLEVVTVEVDVEFHRKAKENLEPYGNARAVFGDSAEFLRGFVPSLEGKLPLFWLDAHWWPPVPLRDECGAVATLPRYVCLLDDFSCWEPDFSGDTFYTTGPTGGPAYLNDVSYVCQHLGGRYFRPAWQPRAGSKGVGLFVKGVDYVPPLELMKPEDFEGFVASRARSIARRKDEEGFVVYPLHPSCGREE